MEQKHLIEEPEMPFEGGRKVKITYLTSGYWSIVTEDFLEKVREKYHYEKKDMSLMGRVALNVVSCLKGQESILLAFPDGSEENVQAAQSSSALGTVIVTLGANIDLLQERYRKAGLLLEEYMVESISSELMLLGYKQVEEWVASHTEWKVVSYHFPGSETQFPLEQIARLLEIGGQRKVTCNEDFCLIPKKSTVFQIELSKNKAEACRELCADCNKRATCERTASLRTEWGDRL